MLTNFTDKLSKMSIELMDAVWKPDPGSSKLGQLELHLLHTEVRWKMFKYYLKFVGNQSNTDLVWQKDVVATHQSQNDQVVDQDHPHG